MAKLSARLTDKIEPPPVYYTSQVQQQYADQRMFELDEKLRKTAGDFDRAKEELVKIKTINKILEQKEIDAAGDIREIESKIDSIKAKVGIFNENLTKCNDEKELQRTRLNESQIQVARLEERLIAAVSELDRMRDPANPDGNVSIKKHILNDKKEIKRLKMEAENERILFAADTEIVKTKDAEIKMLEKELAQMNDMLKICEEELTQAQKDEAEEKEKENITINDYKNLKHERKSFEQRLKDARIKLGVAIAGKNCNMKVIDDMKKREKDLSKQLSLIEKKLKEATGDLDILKNHHKMSKTAMSINNYTKRNKLKVGSVTDNIRVTQSEVGVKFATKAKNIQTQGQLSTRSTQSNPEKKDIKGNAIHKTIVNAERSKNSAVSKRTSVSTRMLNDGAVSQGARLNPEIFKGEDTTNKASTQNTLREQQASLNRQSILGKEDKRNSVQFVPPPRAKLHIR